MSGSQWITVQRENEFLLGVGEVIVAHGIHPEYGVPCLTFTKAGAPGKLGDSAEISAIEALSTMTLVFTTADAVKQHVDRLEIAMKAMADRAADESTPTTGSHP